MLRTNRSTTAKSVKEPKRKSFLEMIKQNFSLHERNIFVHRLVFVGNFLVDEPIWEDKSVIDSFQRCIKLINDRYFDEKLTGYLLLYAKHFCHVLEGSEESIMRFLDLMYENELLETKLGTVKLLVVYHHVNQRFIEDWMILVATPGVNLDDEEDSESDKRYVNYYKKQSIEKLYQLGLSLRQNKMPEESDPPSRAVSRRRIKSKSTSAKKDALLKISVFLPDVEHIIFLIDCPETTDLKQYMEMYLKVPHSDSYEEAVWPIPCDYTPMHIFQKEIVPVGSLGRLGDV